MDKKDFSPILPFDDTTDESFTIYDPVSYVRDVNLIPPEKIIMESGNIIKYYECKIVEPVPVGGK